MFVEWTNANLKLNMKFQISTSLQEAHNNKLLKHQKTTNCVFKFKPETNGTNSANSCGSLNELNTKNTY